MLNLGFINPDPKTGTVSLSLTLSNLRETAEQAAVDCQISDHGTVICSSSAVDGPTGLKHCTGAVTDISCCTRDYPTEDSSGQGQKQSFVCWIPKASGGSWKDFVLSRKRPSAKENRRTYFEQKSFFYVLKTVHFPVLFGRFMV